MQKFTKFIILSNPLQGLRLVDTFPWMMLLTPKTLRFRYRKVPLLLFCFLLLFATAFIGDNLPSVGKVCLFFGFTLVVIFSKTQYLQVHIKLLLVLLFLLAAEDLLIHYAGLLSPLVRDERGALFIFREKSYAALFVGYLISYLPVNRRDRLKDLFVIAAIFYLLQSALGWLIYVVYVYHRFYVAARHLPPPSLVLFVSLILIYLAFELFDTTGLLIFISHSDSLRFLINLESLHIVNLGSIYLHDALGYSAEILDIKIGMLGGWDKLTAQAPFFILAYYFGHYGIILAALFVWFYMMAIPRNSRCAVSFIHSMIFINLFLQGFMLSPYLLGYLFISNLRNT